MEDISRTEEFILLSVHDLTPGAYGAAIRRHIQKIMNKEYSVGAIYVPLDRLEAKGLLISKVGEPTSERGGRRKRYYRLTPAGLAALERAKRLHDRFWSSAPNALGSSWKINVAERTG